MLTVIVPYRDRLAHLRIFIPTLAAFLTKRNVPHRILVVHQADELPFNKGALLNIGFRECEADSDFVCFHDVDMVPEDNSCDYSDCNGPTHLAGSVEQFGFRLPYPSYFGGVVMMRCADYRIINGFSNEYWGWGREDDDFYVRLVYSNLQLSRRPGRYRSLDHRRPVTQADLSKNSHRLLATLLHVLERLKESDRLALLQPIQVLCSRYCTLAVQPLPPESDGLTTVACTEVSRSPIVLSNRSGTIHVTHRMLSVKLHRSQPSPEPFKTMSQAAALGDQ